MKPFKSIGLMMLLLAVAFLLFRNQLNEMDKPINESGSDVCVDKECVKDVIEQENESQNSKACNDNCTDKERLNMEIEQFFGLKPDSYVIECSECSLERGGFIKASILSEGNPLKLYYHWGWCSPAGTYCGQTMCFTSYSNATDTIYEKVKNNRCENLRSIRRVDDYTCTYGEAFDNSTIVKQACLTGSFERVNGSKKTLLLNQISNRCEDSVALFETDYCN